MVLLEVEKVTLGNGRPRKKTVVFDTDEGPRPGSTPEVLAKLRPVFHARGTVTAGNSSQMSDGAAAVTITSRQEAEALDLEPLARFASFAVGGVPPEIMGIGPVKAIPKALKYAGLELSDIDLIELNVAFAAQALAVIQEAGLDLDRVNVNGGAVAPGCHRRQAHRPADPRDETPLQSLRHGDHVHRRGYGCGGDLREPVRAANVPACG